MKKKLLLVSADNILPYQPTLLNLYDKLSVVYDVTIISFTPSFLAKDKTVEGKQVIYISNKTTLFFITRSIDFAFNFFLNTVHKIIPTFTYKSTIRKKYQVQLIKQTVASNKADIYISVDFLALHALQKLQLKSYFLSLEIAENDPFRKNIDYNLIKQVFIQSKERYNYLFNNSKLPYSILPNSPIFKEIKIPSEKNNFIWAGSILKKFGVDSCIQFVQYNKNLSITFKGGLDPFYKKELYTTYADELKNNRVIVNTDYMDVDQFISFIAAFKIGFCFYSWDLINESYNYRSAPSGKLFMYLMAGVPVIASDIEGFQFIKEKKCGVLVKDYSIQSIKSAVEEIELNYIQYEQNCMAVAKEYDFNNYANDIITLIQSNED